MKIAICLPSFNEAQNIQSITNILDKGVIDFVSVNPYLNVEIVNFDSNSIDNTSEIFLKTKTSVPKKSFIIEGEGGKGSNILEFCRYVVENDIDFCLTIDSDITSAQPNWVVKLLEPLVNNGVDFVTPIYERSRFEGSSTNHFAFPVIYALTGYAIRQPIAGDFAFSKKIAQALIQSDQLGDDSVIRYGIDIFMTITALSVSCNIAQVNLGKKIHAPSFDKLEYMFPQIAASAIKTMSCTKEFSNINLNKLDFENNILKNLKFSHKQQAIEMKSRAIENLRRVGKIHWMSQKLFENYLQTVSKKIPDDSILNSLWTDILAHWIQSYHKVGISSSQAQNAGRELLPFFVLRAINYWLWAEKVNALTAESSIIKQANLLRDKLNLQI